MCGGPELLTYAGAGIAVGGATYGGLTARAGAKAQAEVARQNQLVFKANADNEAKRRDLIDARTLLEETRVRANVDKTLGAQRAHFGAANLDTETGSPLLLALSSAAQGEVDVNLVRAGGVLERAESFGREASFIQGGAGEAWKAAISDAKAEEALIATAFGAGTAYLNTMSRWAALAPAAHKPNVNTYSLSRDGGAPSIYGIY